jgi:hypothetical protein
MSMAVIAEPRMAMTGEQRKPESTRSVMRMSWVG